MLMHENFALFSSSSCSFLQRRYYLNVALGSWRQAALKFMHWKYLSSKIIRSKLNNHFLLKFASQIIIQRILWIKFLQNQNVTHYHSLTTFIHEYLIMPAMCLLLGQVLQRISHYFRGRFLWQGWISCLFDCNFSLSYYPSTPSHMLKKAKSRTQGLRFAIHTYLPICMQHLQVIDKSSASHL